MRRQPHGGLLPARQQLAGALQHWPRLRQGEERIPPPPAMRGGRIGYAQQVLVIGPEQRAAQRVRERQIVCRRSERVQHSDEVPCLG